MIPTIDHHNYPFRFQENNFCIPYVNNQVLDERNLPYPNLPDPILSTNTNNAIYIKTTQYHTIATIHMVNVTHVYTL